MTHIQSTWRSAILSGALSAPLMQQAVGFRRPRPQASRALFALPIRQAVGLLMVLPVFFIMQSARAFDYAQCLDDMQHGSSGVQLASAQNACGAKAQNSGRERAVSSAALGMGHAYQVSDLLSDDDLADLMEDFRESAAYRAHLTQALKDQFNTGQFKVSIFSSTDPQCNSNYRALRPTQGLGTSYRYTHRTSPHQSYFDTIKYFRVKPVLCAKQ